MKKTITFIALLALMVAAWGCSSKKEFKIVGKVAQELNMNSISLFDSQGKQLFTAPVVDNKFVLTGSLEQPRKLTLGSEESHFSMDIILENDTYEMEINSDGEVELEGGKIHHDVLGYKFTDEYKKLMKEYNEKTEEAFADVDMDNEEQLTKARETMFAYENNVFDYDKKESVKVIEGNYPTLTKMFALIFNQNWDKYPPEKIKELFGQYEKEIGAHPDMVDFLKNMEESEAMMAKQAEMSNGASYKEIVGEDRNGNSVKLSEIVAKNNYTILEFWASWCGPCRAEIPNLKKAYDKYKSKGLEIVSVSIDSDHDKWIQAMDEEKPTWTNILVEGNFKSPQVLEYGVVGVPASFLINKEGIIVANNYELREFELDRTLEKIMGK